MIQLPRGKELRVLDETVIASRRVLVPMFTLTQRGVRTGNVTVRLFEVELATLVTISIVTVLFTSGSLGTSAT